MLALRRSLPSETAAEYSRRICENILASDEYQNARTLFIYKAVNNEADLSAVALAAKASG